MNETDYPDDIFEDLLGNLGYDEDADVSEANELINDMSKSEVLNRVATWNGLIDYGYTIKRWIKDIYGIDLNDYEDE